MMSNPNHGDHFSQARNHMMSLDHSVKPFVFPERLKALRYLLAYTAHNQERWQDEEAHCARLRQLGYDVEGFCVSIPSPGSAWHFPRLDMEWRRRSRELLMMYEVLEEKLRAKDVLVLWTGAMLHPEFVSELSTYNVYVCSDDPESSDGLSKPVARHFDYAFTRNIACVDRYRDWGCQQVKWLCAAVDPDFCAAMLTEEQILDGHRDLDVILFCERLSGLGDRPRRIERLVQAFPQVYVRGKGWPGGYVGKTEMISAYRRAKIGWNFHLSVGPNNSRLTALPAFGILQICDNKAHLGKIFKLDEEVVGFDTIEECIEKTHYYLVHASEARAIAARGWKRAMTDYTEAREWERILAAIAPHCLMKLDEKPAADQSISTNGHLDTPVHCPQHLAEHKIKLHLGCGNDYWPGYINIDNNQNVRADMYIDFNKIDSILPADTVSEACMIHSLNYLNLWQARDLFSKIYKLLGKEGKIIIETVNVEKAAQQIMQNTGRYDAYIEGIRALHAFGLDQLERREAYSPYAFSWSPWHLQQELQVAGFQNIQVLPAQTHQAWRDMRIEGSKVVGSADTTIPMRDQPARAIPHCADDGCRQTRGRVLFVLDPVMGHATAHVRGLVFKDILRERGWVAEFIDVRQVPEETIIAMASSFDVVYLSRLWPIRNRPFADQARAGWRRPEIR